ncbi:MAG: zinc-dependent metalloprotease family protein [Tepidisphaerales bacterium]
MRRSWVGLTVWMSAVALGVSAGWAHAQSAAGGGRSGGFGGHRHAFHAAGVMGPQPLMMCDCGATAGGVGGGWRPGSGLPLPAAVGVGGGGVELLRDVDAGDGSGGSGGGGAGVASSGLTVPAWSSRPQASAKLYLKFDGITYEGNWGNTGRAPGVVPAYSVDADRTNFSATELNNMFQIWSRVAEAFSPFNVDVTTVDPGTPTGRQSARVIIGGSNAWYSSSAGGVAYIAGFVYADYHFGTAWVFPDNLGGGSPKFVADATIHEAGHLFGLYHQQNRAPDGTLISGYRDFENDPISAPIMGVAYNRQRGVWSGGVVGYSGGQFILQDDLRQIASTSGSPYAHPFLGGGYWNGFGYRADDHGDTAASATVLAEMAASPLGLVAGPGPRVLTASGVIETTSDVDVFQFETWTAGAVSVAVDNAAFGAMLDVRLLLWDAAMTLLADVNPSIHTTGPDFGLDAAWTGTLAAGTYYVGVASSGGYGDVGQYTLTVTLPFATVPEPAGVLGALMVLAWGGLRRGEARWGVRVG